VYVAMGKRFFELQQIQNSQLVRQSLFSNYDLWDTDDADSAKRRFYGFY